MHGSVMLFIDGQLGPAVDPADLLALTDRILGMAV
jgi:hypothetical protein